MDVHLSDRCLVSMNPLVSKTEIPDTKDVMTTRGGNVEVVGDKGEPEWCLVEHEVKFNSTWLWPCVKGMRRQKKLTGKPYKPTAKIYVPTGNRTHSVSTAAGYSLDSGAGICSDPNPPLYSLQVFLAFRDCGYQGPAGGPSLHVSYSSFQLFKLNFPEPLSVVDANLDVKIKKTRARDTKSRENQSTPSSLPTQQKPKKANLNGLCTDGKSNPFPPLKAPLHTAGEPSSTGAFLSLPTRLDLTSQHVSGESGAVGNGGRDLGVGYFSSSQQEKPVFLVLTEIKLN
ncbi:hypothetical protein B0H19DRAFT_1081299 [Mycena capillaripes]|nr:hypothetical protein B0H19DRAFT_1081299 [Mycena capillaripes]